VIDFDILVKLGWTALLGWNLKETVSNGKDIVALKVKIENGLTSGLADLKEQIESHIDGEENRIIQAILRDPRTRSRRNDRKLEPED
jgi:hypothetical protein